MTLYIDIKKIQKLEDIGRSTAQRKLTRIKKCYGIPKYELVTVTEYCEFSRLDITHVLKALGDQ